MLPLRPCAARLDSRWSSRPSTCPYVAIRGAGSLGREKGGGGCQGRAGHDSIARSSRLLADATHHNGDQPARARSPTRTSRRSTACAPRSRGSATKSCPFAVSVREAAELIAREDPNLTIVMVHQDDEHALSLISEAVEFASGPVIATVRDGDADFLARAAEHGISAYVAGHRAGGGAGRDRGRAAPLPRDGQARRQGRRARGRAAAPGRHRARQGDPDGAPRRRRAARRSSCCARTRARARAASSRSRSRSSTATRCCHATRRRGLARRGRGTPVGR